ncbi:MAG: alkaline phosphatase D family protein [Chitinophagales bacterium]|nr:alkaline phosphatase D family protein [Chitinophagales bacterium]MDW8418380.1 alkaline phosphatase D family protein [Chitinophagales bacterium]
MNLLKIIATLGTVYIVFFSQAQQLRSHLDPTLRPFYHGVASGDPLPDRVIIWTRVTPDSGTTGDIEVYWQIATDTSFTQIVNYGKAIAAEANDYCVKADVCGLQPATHYYYIFNALGRNSIIGRTKTAPAANSDNDRVRMAVVSCADYENGYFNVYESIAQKNNVDAVVHLGDYIYEYEPGGIAISNPGGRVTEPDHEVVTLQDYRIRHSHYKLDQQLRRLHQAYPFIAVWDDHETCNDAWRDGAQNHQPATEGPYHLRKKNATETYFNWMPLRKPDPNDTLRIFRKLRYGKLMDLIMLDTRLYDRDEQQLSASDDSTHRLLGPVEMNWFLQQLSDTATRWKIIGNQVMFAPVKVFGIAFNDDTWDGYNYERQRVQQHLMQHNIKNFVVLTGDIHTTWCNDIPGPAYNGNTGVGSLGVEFVVPSVTSANSPLPIGSGLIQSMNPHIKYVNLDEHGYFILDVNKQRVQADYTFVNTNQPVFTNQEGVSYLVNHQQGFLQQSTPLVNVPHAAPLPPLYSKQNIVFYKIIDRHITIPENTQASATVIPSLQICPPVTLNILQGNHGITLSLNGQQATYIPAHDYHGTDTVGFVVCSASQPVICDTVYWYLTITSVKDIDTLTIHLSDSTTYLHCLHFDDVSGPASPVVLLTPSTGQLTLNDSCFSYLTAGNYCGNERAIFAACDNTGQCDTIVFIFKINIPVSTGVRTAVVPKNSNIALCNLFDDLACSPTLWYVASQPSHGTYQLLGDSCLKYFPHFNYTGQDSFTVIGCDTCYPLHCDTARVYITVQEPAAIHEPAYTVLGIHPNPANTHVWIQYYMFSDMPFGYSIFNAAGQLLSQYNSKVKNTGLHHEIIPLFDLPAGHYTLWLYFGNNTYHKIIIKN